MVRTRVGRYQLADSATLEELQALADNGSLEDALLSMDDALADFPVVDLQPPQRQAAMRGQPIPLFRVARWQQLVGAPVVRLRDASGLVALARVEEGLLRPCKVLRD
jgi:tRNA U55 pseudouridine synthase TruB